MRELGQVYEGQGINLPGARNSIEAVKQARVHGGGRALCSHMQWADPGAREAPDG